MKNKYFPITSGKQRPMSTDYALSDNSRQFSVVLSRNLCSLSLKCTICDGVNDLQQSPSLVILLCQFLCFSSRVYYVTQPSRSLTRCARERADRSHCRIIRNYKKARKNSVEREGKSKQFSVSKKGKSTINFCCFWLKRRRTCGLIKLMCVPCVDNLQLFALRFAELCLYVSLRYLQANERHSVELAENRVPAHQASRTVVPIQICSHPAWIMRRGHCPTDTDTYYGIVCQRIRQRSVCDRAL